MTTTRGRSRRTALAANLLLLAGGIALAAGAGEVATRLAFSPRRNVVAFRFDPRYGFTHVPSTDERTYMWSDGAMWRYRVNARGFRGSDWPDVVPPGRQRMLVMGDSYTFGVGVADSAAYPAVADRALRDSAVVVNAGTPAWGPQNALAYLETAGRDIQANCLVYGMFEGNDVMDGVVADLFRLDHGTLSRTPLRDRRERVVRIDQSLRHVPGYVLLLRHSQLFNIVRGAVFSRVSRNDPANSMQRLYTSAGADTFANALDLHIAVLQRLAEVSLERFGAVGLVLIPMRGQLTGATDPIAMPFPRAWADSAHARTLTWATEAGVPVLDLNARWAHLPQESVDSLYFRRDFHLSAHGARAVGESLAREAGRLCARRTGARTTS
jgi:lysophospholipase L1-like esterase